MHILYTNKKNLQNYIDEGFGSIHTIISELGI